jgi:RsiW-degrading membrane proteinase PrsW (M82 family)
LLSIWVGSEGGISGLLLGLFLAFLPVPFYVLLALWIDRYEPEPAWMLAAAFIWGAVIATAFSAIVNTANGLLIAALAGLEAGDLFSAIISAPIFEEGFKGIALFIFFLWRKDEFDNIVDGILYAAMLGLGFAMVENVIYYGREFGSSGLEGSLTLFAIRGLALPFIHPLCTSMTGIGLGYARQSVKGCLRYLSPFLGYLAAVTLHGIWNLSASLGGWVIAYFVILIPTLIAVFILLAVVRNREGKILRQYLLTDLQNGRLTDLEYQAMYSLPTRARLLWSIFFGQGFSAWRKATQFYQLGGELAFHRWRVARGVVPNDDAALQKEIGYLRSMGRAITPQA